MSKLDRDAVLAGFVTMGLDLQMVLELYMQPGHIHVVTRGPHGSKLVEEYRY